MQKTTSSSSKKNNSLNCCSKADNAIQPKNSTIENLLAFAAAYHVQEITKDKFVELILN
jgi:hypothetical protein